MSRWQRNQVDGHAQDVQPVKSPTPVTPEAITTSLDPVCPLRRHEVRDCAARRERGRVDPDRRPRGGPGDQTAPAEKAHGGHCAGRGRQRANHRGHQEPGGAAKDRDGDREDKGQRVGQETRRGGKLKEGVRSKAADL